MTLPRLRPAAAERARTVLSHATTPVIDSGGDGIEVVDLMGVDRDGSLVLLVGLASPLALRVAEHAAPCRVHAALMSPVPGPDRVLDQVTVAGIRAFAPVRVDPFGLTFRVDGRSGSAMVRLDFARPLRSADDLPTAMNALQVRAAQVRTCPFSGQPRSAAPPP